MKQRARQDEQIQADVLWSAQLLQLEAKTEFFFCCGLHRRMECKEKSKYTYSPQHRAINQNSQQQIKPPGDIPTTVNSFFAVTTRTFHTTSPTCSQRTPLHELEKGSLKHRAHTPGSWCHWILEQSQEFKITIYRGALDLNNNA